MDINKANRFSWLPAGFLFLIIISLLSCSQAPNIQPEGPYWVDNDRKDIPEPSYQDPNLLWMSLKRSFFDQIIQGLDMARNARKLTGHPHQAVNINSYDEVPNSSWFTNRHGFKPLTAEEIMRGPAITPGPDTTGPWQIIRAKVQGATPGFWIEDARGDQYIMKFDPPENPEMATAAAAMGSRYLYACGYNVPQETIVYYHPDILTIKPGVKFEDSFGIKREFTGEDLERILKKVHRDSNGMIRSLASLSLGKFGKIKGPFSYMGTRFDDPNDWFKHEDRRDLRGLYVIASLVNHYDLKDQNSLDVYVTENGRRFLRHYLIDFGSTFGSDGSKAKNPRKGYANTIDLRDAMVSLLTLGLKVWGWEYAESYKYPSIGYFESKIFHPAKFDAIYPNPAFENMTDRDAYWGAKIVMAWRDQDLEALVETGQYSNPRARSYLLRTLRERRNKIGTYWFSKVNPLDYFEFNYIGRDIKIDFDDLGVKYSLWPRNARYRWEIRYRDEVLKKGDMTDTEIVLAEEDLIWLASAFKPGRDRDLTDDYVYTINIHTKRGRADWSKPTRIHLWYNPDENLFSLIGIKHVD